MLSSEMWDYTDLGFKAGFVYKQNRALVRALKGAAENDCYFLGIPFQQQLSIEVS